MDKNKNSETTTSAKTKQGAYEFCEALIAALEKHGISAKAYGFCTYAEPRWHPSIICSQKGEDSEIKSEAAFSVLRMQVYGVNDAVALIHRELSQKAKDAEKERSAASFADELLNKLWDAGYKAEIFHGDNGNGPLGIICYGAQYGGGPRMKMQADVGMLQEIAREHGMERAMHDIEYGLAVQGTDEEKAAFGIEFIKKMRADGYVAKAGILSGVYIEGQYASAIFCGKLEEALDSQRAEFGLETLYNYAQANGGVDAAVKYAKEYMMEKNIL